MWAGWFAWRRRGSDENGLLNGCLQCEDLLGLRRAAGVDEPEEDEDRHHCCEHERADGANQGDLGEDGEPVGLKEKTPQRGPLENRLDLGLSRYVSRRTLGQRQSGSAQLGVGLATTDFLQVHGDEV